MNRSAADQNTEKAILAVSFGTSHESAGKAAIDAIEQALGEAFPDYRVYRAWTSKMIIAKLKKRGGPHILNVKEAMEQMIRDGVSQVVVQPAHVISGIENDQMKEDVLSFREKFHSISFGAPLLASEEDKEAVIQIIAEEFSSLPGDEALVLMGHGSAHHASSIYAALDYKFKDMGFPNIFLGTMKADPSMSSLLRRINAFRPKKITLAPFLIAAGDHASSNMAGDGPDSWMNRFRKEGYEVVPVMKGLGEYEGIRKLLIRHAKDAILQNQR